MAAVSFENVSYAYPNAPTRALEGASFEIASGQMACFFGRSGSGKSTLLKCLKPVLLPGGERTGRVLVAGRDVVGMPPREQAVRVGYVFQNPDAQIVTDKVVTEIAFGLENLGVLRSEMRMRMAEITCLLGLSGLLDKNVNQLSGGQKQLVNLASVMVMQPSVLVLDEPTSALDPVAAAHFHETVAQLNAETGVTVLFAEQRLDEVLPMCDLAFAMDASKIVAAGRPHEVAAKLTTSTGETSELFRLLPDVAQIAIEVGEGVTSGIDAKRGIPLNVREGRAWLADIERDGDKTGAQKANLCAQGFEAAERPTAKEKSARGNFALELKDVWFRHAGADVDALKGATFAAKKGEITALLGANGSGKSTLLKCACGVAPHVKGKIFVDGEKMSARKFAKSEPPKIALMPQSAQDIMLCEKVLDDMREAYYENGAKSADEQVKRIARLLKIEHLLHKSPLDLSGGELQRAALAKVLMRNSNVILLDEPTRGLDNIFKTELADVLRQLCAQGKTVVVATHDISFAAACAQNVALMFDGEVVGPHSAREMLLNNRFYTTPARRMSAGIFENALTNKDVVQGCLSRMV